MLGRLLQIVWIFFEEEEKETKYGWRIRRGLMGRTMVVHVRYKSLYISLPFSAKQQREITKFCVLGEPRPRRQMFWISLWN